MPGACCRRLLVWQAVVLIRHAAGIHVAGQQDPGHRPPAWQPRLHADVRHGSAAAGHPHPDHPGRGNGPYVPGGHTPGGGVQVPSGRVVRSWQDNSWGRAWSLYRDQAKSRAWSVVDAKDALATYQATSELQTWPGAQQLRSQTPDCTLQLTSAASYSLQDVRTRKAMWLATRAACTLLRANGRQAPDCGAAVGQVCEKKLVLPPVPEAEFLETVAGPAILVAALSWLCEEEVGQGAVQCNVLQVEETGVTRVTYAGLALQDDGNVTLTGLNASLNGLPVLTLLETKITQAQIASFHMVVLARGDRDAFQSTKHREDPTTMMLRSRKSPTPLYCESLCCLVKKFFMQAGVVLWCREGGGSHA